MVEVKAQRFIQPPRTNGSPLPGSHKLEGQCGFGVAYGGLTHPEAGVDSPVLVFAVKRPRCWPSARVLTPATCRAEQTSVREPFHTPRPGRQLLNRGCARLTTCFGYAVVV